MQIKPFQHCLRYAAQTRVPLVSQARYLTVTSRARQHESPVFSAGSDASELTTMLDELVSPNGQWTLSEGGRGVERHYKFKTFKATWHYYKKRFMNRVVDQCIMNSYHHPEWANVYNSVFIKWTTHEPSGISQIDLESARLCDELAFKTETTGTKPSADSESLKPLTGKAGNIPSSTGVGKPEQEEQAQKEKDAVEKQEDGPEDKQGNPGAIGGQPS